MTERCLAGAIYDCDPNTCQHDCAAKIDLSPAIEALAEIDRQMQRAIWFVVLMTGVIMACGLAYTKGAENWHAVQIAEAVQ